MNDSLKYFAQFFFFGILIIVGVGCKDQNTTMQKDIRKMQMDLETRILKLKEIETKVATLNVISQGDFLHEVYFNLKKEISAKERIEFFTILSELKTIQEAKGTQIGIPKKTGDPRIRSDYDVVLYMSFKNLADYKTYQNHKTHLSVKKRIGNLLAAPPFVYDFEIK